MRHDNSELADLQRRAYGPGGSLRPEERARLARLEHAARGSDTSLYDAADAEFTAPTTRTINHGTPASPDKDSLSFLAPRTMHTAPGTQAIDGASGMSPNASAREPRRRDTPRWFPPTLLVAIAVASASVMLLAGVIGWAWGFTAAVSRTVPATEGLEYVTELREDIHATLPDTEFVASLSRQNPLVPDDWGYSLTYFESLSDSTFVFVITPMIENEVRPDGTRTMTLASDGPACLQVSQVIDRSDANAATRGGSACGSPDIDMTLDLVTVPASDTSSQVNTIATDDYAPGTVLRFIYRAPAAITVWQLPPGP